MTKERKLVGFVQTRWQQGEDAFQPIIEERDGKGGYETYWQGKQSFDSEVAHEELAEACHRYGLIERADGSGWERPL